MSNAVSIPKTLLEAITLYSDEQRAFEAIRDQRWPKGVVCPFCASERVRYSEVKAKDKVRRLWSCNGCRKQFTAKTGSIFEDSPLPFSKWLPAMWLIVNAKNGISSYEIHRALGVTQKTAWFMLHRIRLAMQRGNLNKLMDNVEVDETYIGGKARNMHQQVRAERVSSRGVGGKTVVVGMLERGGGVKFEVVPSPTKPVLQGLVVAHVLKGSNIYTDALRSYTGLESWFAHQVIDHAVCYVQNQVHTNGLENVWSLLKRTMLGTYVSVEPFHLFRYLDEYAFRFNERKATDAERFDMLTSQVSGKRLTYKSLTGKDYS